MLRYSSLLPIEIVVTDEGVDALLEIMRPILVVIAVTTSRRYQNSTIIVIRSIVWSYRRT
jgi:hypothetical protein